MDAMRMHNNKAVQRAQAWRAKANEADSADQAKVTDEVHEPEEKKVGDERTEEADSAMARGSGTTS